MAARMTRTVLTATLAAAALLVFVPRAGADPVTYKTVTAQEIEAASTATHVTNSIIAGMYAAGYEGDVMGLAQQLRSWWNRSGAHQWPDALADYHANSPRGINDPAAVVYARKVMNAAEHVPPQLAGAMSTGSALTLAGIVAAAATAGGLAGVWDELAAGAAGTGTVGKIVSKAKGALGGGGGNGSAADSPQSYLRTSVIAATAAAAAGSVARLMSKGTTANVSADWFHALYGKATAYSAGIAVLALILAAIEGMWRHDGEMIISALRALPFAMLMTVALTALIGVGIAIVDTAGTTIAGNGLNDGRHVLYDLAALFLALAAVSKGASALGHPGLAHITGFTATLFSIGGVVGGGLILLELLLREVAIYVGVFFAPLILAARVWPRLAHAGARLGQMLGAVIVSKLVLVLALGLAGTAIMHGGVTGIAMGLAVLFVAAIMPFWLYRLIGVAEHHFSGRGVAQQAGIMVAAGTAASRLGSVIGWNSSRVDQARGSSGTGSEPPAPSPPSSTGPSRRPPPTAAGASA